MTDAPESHDPPLESERGIRQAAELLGGSRLLHHRLTTPLDAHEMILQGFPGEALKHLVDHSAVLRNSAGLETALGMSMRTFQRRKEGAAKPLSPEQSGRTWKFAEILAKATSVLGSQAEAEQWLVLPAVGLEQRRPIDLLATPAGVELVETFLERLEYGVYT